MPAADDDVRALLEELRSLVSDISDFGQIVDTGDSADDVDELTRRLDNQALRVLVAGEAKRGKSTLVNALLGRDVLPTGVLPLTAISTTVRYGTPDLVVVRFADGRAEEVGLDQLAELVTEHRNPGNVRDVHEVTVHVSAPLLQSGLELVDTPGVGSVYAHNTTEAVAALDRMDAAIFVLTVDPPISASERALLRQVRDRAVTVFCVLNKVDRMDESELAEASRFTSGVVADELGGEVPLYPMSARGSSGLEDFRAAFTRYLATAGSADLTRSITARAARLARSVAESQQAALATLALSGEELTDRLGQFRGALDAVNQRRADAVAVGVAEFARLRAETDAQAADLLDRVRPALVRDVADRTAAAAGSPSTVESDGLAYVAQQVVGVVEQWRSARADELQAFVTALDDRLSGELTDHIATVRDAAAQLFALDLPALPPPAGLAAARAFSYGFTPDPGQVDALAAVVRHRLPGRLARRQVTRYVTDQAAQLLDKHVGRARAGFQAQLAETRRGFERELDRRFVDGAGRIAGAVDAAATLRTTRQQHVADARARAKNILGRARTVADRCDTLAQGAATEANTATS